MNTPPSIPPESRMTPRKIAATFLTGLIAVLPILVTLALVMWLINCFSYSKDKLNYLMKKEKYLLP